MLQELAMPGLVLRVQQPLLALQLQETGICQLWLLSIVLIQVKRLRIQLLLQEMGAMVLRFRM